MARRRHQPEQIITKLRDADVGMAQGRSVAQACKSLAVAEQTFYRWRKECGGMQITQAQRLNLLQGDYARLRRAVADLPVDNRILKEAAEGNF